MFFKRKRRLRDFAGYVDSAADGGVAGWVYDRQHPKERFDVEIVAAGAVIGVTRAETLRLDLAAAGFGDGRYGFRFDLPSGDFAEETLAARVRGESYWLQSSTGRKSFAPFDDELANSTRRGLPLLRPALSLRGLGSEDVEIATELQREWRDRIGRAETRALGGGGAMWTTIVSDRHHQLISLLGGSDPRALAEHLVDLQKTSAAAGLEQGDHAYRDFQAASPEGRRAAVAPYHDMLASLAQYLGLARAECAEQNYEGESLATDSQEIAARIEHALGFELAPPTVFDGLYGLAIGDRILTGRDIQALYAALRAVESSCVTAPRICEIGGGFGKVARYALLRGARSVTIIDLPTVAAMQYFFLRRALPADVPVAFRHPTEPSRGKGVELVLASHIGDDADIATDIVVNCDSFPEMGDAICRGYFAKIGAWAPLLLSINQEGNRQVGNLPERQSVVGSLLPDYGFTRRYRFRSWIRRGFVEELWSAAQPSVR